MGRRPVKVAAVALANKIARIAWAMMVRGEWFNELVQTAFRAVCSSRVGDEAGEAFVHVILMVAVEEGIPRIIGDKIDLCRRESRHAERVFHQAGHRLVADFRDLEGMAVRMHRMNVTAVVVHNQAISLAPRAKPRRRKSSVSSNQK
jgi:hypothetical protein